MTLPELGPDSYSTQALARLDEIAAISSPARVSSVVLSERERQLIADLRRIDFWRAGRARIVTARWDGVRLIVFDGQQIS